MEKLTQTLYRLNREVVDFEAKLLEISDTLDPRISRGASEELEILRESPSA